MPFSAGRNAGGTPHMRSWRGPRGHKGSREPALTCRYNTGHPQLASCPPAPYTRTLKAAAKLIADRTHPQPFSQLQSFPDRRIPRSWSTLKDVFQTTAYPRDIPLINAQIAVPGWGTQPRRRDWSSTTKTEQNRGENPSWVSYTGGST